MKLSLSWLRWWQSMLLLLVTFFSLVSTPASAATEYNEKIQFSDDFDSCAGERVLVTGTQHIIGRFTEDAAGRLHFGFTRNTKGTGIGQISGDEYILTDAVARASLEFVSGAVATLTEQYTSRLIYRGEDGSDDDTIVHFVSRITITADGDVTSVVEIESVECR
jgi:hypothetical protein